MLATRQVRLDKGRSERAMTSEPHESQEEDNRMSGTSIMPTIRPAGSVDAAKEGQPAKAKAPDKITVKELNFYYSKTRALKDIGLALELARDVGVNAPAAQHTRDLLEATSRAGYGRNYYPAMVKLIEKG